MEVASVNVVEPKCVAGRGSAGLHTQMAGRCVTVSAYSQICEKEGK